MLNSEYLAISGELPTGFSRDYDAHVYYDPRDRWLAERIREKARQHFGDSPVLIGALRDEKVGPHPIPMFELNFPTAYLDHVLSWLKSNTEGLSVLIHRVTGDDVSDHSEGATWLGSPLPLDTSKFEISRK